MSYDSKLQNSPYFLKSNEQTPLKKQSILKKTPSRNSFKNNDPRRNTPSKNVKFDSKVNVNQFFSSPNEKYHEILINSHDFEQNEKNMDFLNDETVWSNTKKSIDYKSECLEEEIEQIEQEINRIAKENQELSSLIDNEQNEFSKNGYKNIDEKEIEQLLLQNKSLQELVNEKIQENETLKQKIKENDEKKPFLLQEKFAELEKNNFSLEKQINTLKIQYENEINQFRIVANVICEEKNLLQSIQKELELKEFEIETSMKQLRNFDQLLMIDKNSSKFNLEVYILICAEFERLQQILLRKREENQALEEKNGCFQGGWISTTLKKDEI